MDAHQPNLFPLKLLVICLGVVLLGGIVFVLATVVMKANGTAGQPCPDTAVHLEGKGNIVSITPQDSTVQIVLDSDTQSNVLTVDRCTGKISQTLTVVP